MNYSTIIITLFLFTTADYLVSMDQKPDPLILKIIPVKGVQKLLFLGNNEIIVNGKLLHGFTKIINIFNDALTDFDHILHVTNNNDKTKALLLCNGFRTFNMTIYDSENKNSYSLSLPFSMISPHINSFGYAPNTVLLEKDYGEVVVCNYVTQSIEPLCDLKFKYPHLSIQKCLTNKKILCWGKEIWVNRLHVYDPAKDEARYLTEEVHFFCQQRDESTFLDANSDNSFIVLWQNDLSPIKVLDLKTNKCFDISGNNISVAIHPNNNIIALLNRDGAIKYWDVQTQKIVLEQKPFKDSYYHEARSSLLENLSFSTNGKLLAVGFEKKCAILHVPFEVIYGVGTEQKLTLMLFLLKQHLLKDVVEFLVSEKLWGAKF